MVGILDKRVTRMESSDCYTHWNLRVGVSSLTMMKYLLSLDVPVEIYKLATQLRAHFNLKTPDARAIFYPERIKRATKLGANRFNHLAARALPMGISNWLLINPCQKSAATLLAEIFPLPRPWVI
jgi:hypothetical protein